MYEHGTAHYNLPQTVGTDKRDWLDTNQAFADVDAALYTASETASSTASALSGLSQTVAGIQGNVTDIQQDVSEIDGRVTQQGSAITGLTTRIDNVKADALDMICAVDEGTAQVATVAVTAGKYFRYNDVLYMASANINIGDSIIPNTNCRATNVATELESIQGGETIAAEDVGYNNTASGLAATNVQAAIDEISNNISKNVFGAVVNIIGYTSTRYQCPSDGYFRIYSDNASHTYGEVHDAATGGEPNTYPGITAGLLGTAGSSQSIFVKKGMYINVSGNTTSGTVLAQFIPLT